MYWGGTLKFYRVKLTNGFRQDSYEPLLILTEMFICVIVCDPFTALSHFIALSFSHGHHTVIPPKVTTKMTNQ